MSETRSIHGMWSSRLAFVLAASGSAVGLGNIWRFPYLASDNGGGAFVLLYLGCIFAMGVPLLIAEVLVGRRGRMSPINSLLTLAPREGHARGWAGIGVLGLVAALLVLSFYSVVAGWTLHYASVYLGQLFGGAGITDPKASFEALLADPLTLLLWHSVFMLLTIAVVALGVEKGLERAVRWMMPALFVLLLGLVGYGISTGHFGRALAFLFTADFSKIDGSVLLAALGQAFFSLSLGVCGMMAYGAYLPRDVSIPRASVSIALTDTAVAILAGLAIFPVLFHFALDPAGGGPGLIFTTLPLAFADMWGGALYGIAFFVLLLLAAWTSSISLLESPTAFLVERTRLGRRRAAIAVGVLVWALGFVSLLGMNVWSAVRVGELDLMGVINFVASDLMLPIGGLLICVYAGWVLPGRSSREELPQLGDGAYRLWLWAVRWLVPLLVLAVLAAMLLARIGD